MSEMKKKMGLSLVGAAITLSAYAATWVGMIYGWGLSPQSWPWIIGTAIGGMVLLGVGSFVSGAASDS